MCRPKGSWFWDSLSRTGYPFQRRFLERGIIFRTHESFKLSAATCYSYKPVKLVKAKLVIENLLVCCVLKSNKQRNNLKNRALESYAILERGIKNWPISRTGYHFECKFFLKRGPNLETRAAHTHPKYTRVHPPPPGVRRLFLLRVFWASLLLIHGDLLLYKVSTIFLFVCFTFISIYFVSLIVI